MCDSRWKKALLAVLVVCFGVQTTLVYSDEPATRLSDAGVEGRRIWHANACHTCHQLYGQGGFLGPDLTNAASRLDSTRLRSLLTVGSGQMPAFHFDDREIAALTAFLREIDRPELGRGQLRLGTVSAETAPQAVFERAVEEALPAAGSAAARGFAAVRARPCAACHHPLRASPVGAPDLSTVVGRLSREELVRVLEAGRPERGMPAPAPAFPADGLPDVVAYLEFLSDRRPELAARMEALAPSRRVEWGRLPWWEFPE